MTILALLELIEKKSNKLLKTFSPILINKNAKKLWNFLILMYPFVTLFVNFKSLKKLSKELKINTYSLALFNPIKAI
jgi:hypothetical protein